MQWARHLLAGGGDQSTLDLVFSWEVALLFVLFVFITLIWEFSVAFFSFLSFYYSGRRALWITRLKDEILALGVVTLVLYVIEAPLSKICIPGGSGGYDVEMTSPPYAGRRSLLAGPEHQCPDGTRLLFTLAAIHETHYLLFFTAVVQILYTCTSLSLCLAKLQSWRNWEKQARDGQYLDIGRHFVMRNLGSTWYVHVIFMVYQGMVNKVTQSTYTLLRLLFKFRMDANFEKHHDVKLPSRFNFLNTVEQAMEISFTEAAENSWILSAVMAVFLAIPRQAYPLYFLAGISGLMLLTVAAKLQSILTHLSATALVDFNDEIAQYQVEQRKGFRADTDTTEPGAVAEAQLVKVEGSARIVPPVAVAEGVGEGLAINLPSNKVVPYSSADSTPARTLGRYESRLKLRLKDECGIVKEECQALFWFKSPGFLMLIFQLCYIENALSLTLVFYSLVRNREAFIAEEGEGPIIALVIADFIMLFVGAWSILPVFALVNTAGTNHPKKMMEELQRMKNASGEEDFAKGIGGALLKMCFHGAREEEGLELDESQLKFIRMLADHAGVVGAQSGDSGSKNREYLYVTFATMWMQRMNEWKDSETYGGSPSAMYTVKGRVSELQAAFNAIDKNKSGTISARELAAVLHAMGLRANIDEVTDMVKEVDTSGSDAIEFPEFVLFLIFKFFDHNNDGYLTHRDVQDSMQLLEMPVDAAAADEMIDFVERAMASDSADIRGRLEAPEFIHFFADIQFVDEKTDEPFSGDEQA